MSLLTDLPPEILHHVLGHVDPPDLAWIPRICKSLYYTVTGNTHLFKLVYLNHLDKPPRDQIDWEKALKDTVRLQVICRRASLKDKKKDLRFVCDTAKYLLQNAATDTARDSSSTHVLSRNADLLRSIFQDESNQSAFLCQSFIFRFARGYGMDRQDVDSLPRADHQASAHLHCLYGVPILYTHPHRTRSSKMSPYACSKVYDLRQYTSKTHWGPFMDDESDFVDWEKVEAIMIVIGANLKKLHLVKNPLCKDTWDVPFAGCWAGSYKPLTVIREPDPLDLDPYGVTGTWLRVVCFLDYTDFFAYNFTSDPPPPGAPRHAIDIGEATRLILMKVRVTNIEPPGPYDGQALPIVHFKGTSSSLDDSLDENANSDLRGMVRLTREGEVRWTTFSIFEGEERWRSESVQIGGPKSAKGVFGNWFDKDFDPRGPAGPTAFWKLSETITEASGYRAFMRDLLPLLHGHLEEGESDGDLDFPILDDDYEDEDDDEDEEDEPGIELEITDVTWISWADN
ncbi:hypothetical protein F4779DRAFT_618455 [Xylariaceae sp. FL0662B]|nr:hypothetical protein F4779DRAFT_618455 [Xylariaceae sp. FL0662B]